MRCPRRAPVVDRRWSACRTASPTSLPRCGCSTTCTACAWCAPRCTSSRAWSRRTRTAHRHPRHRSLPARRRRRAAEAIAAAFASSTFESVARADIMRWKYGKLMNNLGNAVDALCGPDRDARRAATARLATKARRAWPPPGSTLRRPRGGRRPAGRRLQWGGDGGRSRPGASSWQSLARGHRVDRGRLPQRRDRAARPSARCAHPGERCCCNRSRARRARERGRPGIMIADELIHMVRRSE